MTAIRLVVFGLLFGNSIMAQENGFSIIEKQSSKQIDVLYKGKLLTAYCYYDSVKKPFLFPVNTLDGITITRGYPVAPRSGERTDHPHHTGMWLNYESVNGFDFWNNSTAIPLEKRDHYGSIIHVKVLAKNSSGNQAMLKTQSKWITPGGNTLLDEITEYNFSVKDSLFFIDRKTTLTAKDTTVIFKDVKDGFFAIRVARELEMPSQQQDTFIDDKGNKTTVPKTDNQNVTGMYYSSNGLTGDSVWSSKGIWTMLKGTKDGKPITIGMFDHPSNIGYPTYWHARGYGLFALNPLGREVFSNGKEKLNFMLKPGELVTFRYRVLVASSQSISAEKMNAVADDFSKLK